MESEVIRLWKPPSYGSALCATVLDRWITFDSSRPGLGDQGTPDLLAARLRFFQPGKQFTCLGPLVIEDFQDAACNLFKADAGRIAEGVQGAIFAAFIEQVRWLDDAGMGLDDPPARCVVPSNFQGHIDGAEQGVSAADGLAVFTPTFA